MQVGKVVLNLNKGSSRVEGTNPQTAHKSVHPFPTSQIVDCQGMKLRMVLYLAYDMA